MSLEIATAAHREEDDFFEALAYAHVEPLPGSEYQINDTLDDTLNKYIFEPITPVKKVKPSVFTPHLSPIEEVDERYSAQEGGDPHDESLFVVILFMHGGYSIDNRKEPVASITRKNRKIE